MSYFEQKRTFDNEKKDLLNLIKNQRFEIKKLKEKYDKDINILNFIVQNLPGSVYWKNQKGVYLGHNNYAKNLLSVLGFTSEVIGKTDYDIFPKKVADDFRKTDLAVLAGKSLIAEEVTILPNLTKMIQLSSKIPLLDKTKKIIGILGISLDITDRKKAELAKEEFIMNMAHDLRTPLAGVMGLTRALQVNETEMKIQEYAHWIHGASEQLLELLNAVLDALNTEHKLEQVYLEPIQLSQLAKELQTLMYPSLLAKQLNFSLKLDKSLPLIMTDRIKLKRLLVNLLSNAVKFTQQGQVGLEIKLLAKNKQHAKIAITIIDTGIGIAEDKLDKIFDRFYRDQPSYLGVYTGYGLGLYLVQKATESLGGSIQVSSKLGEGSCFSLEFNFPLAKDVDSISTPVAESSAIQPAVKRSGTVLIAEDNALVSYAVTALLTHLGYEVVAVTEGKAALKALQNQVFIWALLDIGLPKLQGTEVVHQYRYWENQNNKSHLPIFALTAHAEKKIKDQCEQVGFDAVLQKPFTEKDINVIEKFLK